MSEKKYVGSEALIRLVAQLKAGFASLVHTHKLEDITDYAVDSALSDTSTNPVQNQALKSKFDSVDSAIAGKAASSHTHDDRYYTEDEVDEKISGITSGTVVVKEAEHAESADTATSATTATTATNANHATTADSATSATTATSATKATQDGNGKVIADTYETIASADAREDELTELINGKADSSHAHAISDVTSLQSSLDAKVPTSRTVNGKALTSNITLSASDVSAYSKTEIDSKVSTLNSAISGKEASGTAASAVSTHNTSTSAHNDIRLLIEDLTTRLNALANSTDEDLDQMAEIVEYIKANKSLIDSVTTSKVNVSDIIDNLTTNVANKPLSAAQGVVVKSLIDTLQSEVDSKADEGHTHNYAGSSSAGGVANSAAKLETARTISLTGDVAGSASFDGSGDASISTSVTSMHGVTASSDDGVAYTATVSGIMALTAGVSFIMIPSKNSTSTTPTLNVNGLGAKGLRMRGSAGTGTAMSASIAAWLTANRPVQITYNGLFWVAEVTRPAATDLSGIVPVTSGGTGASVAEDALANLGGLSSADGAVGTTNLADESVTVEKLDSSIGIISVSTDEPTDESVMLWVQI